MFPTRRRHPLQTFRFWFFIIGSAALTLAWRFDLLPVRIGQPETGRKLDESFQEVVLSEPDEVGNQESHVSPAEVEAELQAAKPAAPADPGDAKDQFEPFFRTTRAADLVSQPNAVADLPSRPKTSRSAKLPSIPVPRLPEAASDATDVNAGVIQTAAISNPLASREKAPVLQANRPPTLPTIDFTNIDSLTQSNATADQIEAHRELSRLYWQQPESRGELRKRIDTLAQRIYFMPQPHYMPAHEIEPGDMLQNIGKQYDVPWQYLAKLNRVDPQRIRAGQRLKVIKGPFSAVINLSEFELTIHAHGYYVTRYSVGIGKDGSSPIGNFAVQNKQVDPTYYGADGVIEHDDPANPLGERWIDIGDSYGIHGTIDPDSIGKCESRGCIRMRNEDVAAVYDLLGVGSSVTIRE